MYWVERVFKHEGLTCVVILGDLGHRCGYVGVPENHFLFGKEYHEELEELAIFREEREKQEVTLGKDIGWMAAFVGMRNSLEYYLSVHGGITYTDGGSYPIDLVYHRPWWIGFDCGHAGDGKDLSVMPEARREFFFNDGGVLRTVEYVEEQCCRLAEQLVSLDAEYKRRKK